MKKCSRTILFVAIMSLQLLFSDRVLGYIFDGNKVNFTKEEVEDIDFLVSTIKEHNSKAIINLPASVRREITEKKDDMCELSQNSMEWISGNLISSADEELSAAIRSVVRWSGLHGDDVQAILYKAFRNQAINQEFNLHEEIGRLLLYWRENRKPSVRFSPDGQGRINWLWTLDVDKRMFGALHIGIDETKRTFICYESDIGVYFPEGETLERIYAEIVQVPEMAGTHLGKGRKENARK